MLSALLFGDLLVSSMAARHGALRMVLALWMASSALGVLRATDAPFLQPLEAVPLPTVAGMHVTQVVVLSPSAWLAVDSAARLVAVCSATTASLLPTTGIAPPKTPDLFTGFRVSQAEQAGDQVTAVIAAAGSGVYTCTWTLGSGRCALIGTFPGAVLRAAAGAGSRAVVGTELGAYLADLAAGTVQPVPNVTAAVAVAVEAGTGSLAIGTPDRLTLITKALIKYKIKKRKEKRRKIRRMNMRGGGLIKS